MTSQGKSTIAPPRQDVAGSNWEQESDTDESLDYITLSPVLSFCPEYAHEYPASPIPQASSPTPNNTRSYFPHTEGNRVSSGVKSGLQSSSNTIVDSTVLI